MTTVDSQCNANFELSNLGQKTVTRCLDGILLFLVIVFLGFLQLCGFLTEQYYCVS